MEQCRALGLCFKCGEKYYPGHQCKVKVNMLLGQTELEEEGEGERRGIKGVIHSTAAASLAAVEHVIGVPDERHVPHAVICS